MDDFVFRSQNSIAASKFPNFSNNFAFDSASHDGDLPHLNIFNQCRLRWLMNQLLICVASSVVSALIDALSSSVGYGQHIFLFQNRFKTIKASFGSLPFGFLFNHSSSSAGMSSLYFSELLPESFVGFHRKLKWIVVVTDIVVTFAIDYFLLWFVRALLSFLRCFSSI